MKPTSPKNTVRLCAAIAALLAAATASAAPLLNFQFNEGTGVQTTDAINSVVGRFGIHQNPLVDTVTLMDASPSGLPGDRCFTNSGSGFLLVDDAVSPVLNITNGPITIETWIYVDFATVPKTAEGIAGYGSSYKLGMRGGYQVFTLFGISDITNTAAGQIPAGQWVHLAAAWEPGVGVHFFVNGIEHLEPHTALAARPVANYYLGIGSEGFANSAVAAYDRLRIHNALLTAAELD
ncbi:MAG TPA: LamG-like jellyroll fold domain-containing protein, partial [Clostridia bacterium]|nr:LamG-like jellyroll fold domain-containing protein [Clostridia bacterium]